MHIMHYYAYYTLYNRWNVLCTKYHLSTMWYCKAAAVSPSKNEDRRTEVAAEASLKSKHAK